MILLLTGMSMSTSMSTSRGRVWRKEADRGLLMPQSLDLVDDPQDEGRWLQHLRYHPSSTEVMVTTPG